MFQAMKRIVDNLAHQSMGESALERAIHSSFLGMSLCFDDFVLYDNSISRQ